MEVVIAFTLYLAFCTFLILPHLGAPPIFPRMAIGLCASELVAALGWSFTRGDCYPECPAMTGTFASAAGVQIPVLTAAVLALSAAYGLFVARRW